MNPLRLRSLVLLFFCALLLFLPLRWDAEPWLRQQLAWWQSSLPFSIEVASIGRSGLGVTARGVDLQVVEQTPSLHVSGLRLEPDWLQLLQGNPALHVQWQADAGTGDITIGWHDETVELSSLDVRLHVPWLQQNTAVSLPLRFQGEMRLTGNIRLQRQMEDQHLVIRPQSAGVKLHWQNAVALMGKDHFALGDYTFEFNSVVNKAWPWQLTGGTLLKLQGKGAVQISDMAWSKWPLFGTITSSTQPGSMLANMLGKQHNMRLTGTLAQPHLQL